ncbi:hypothetical protein HYN59_07235 [Flavobacterium album]|uniref:Phage major capsid protein n=1 Tax=Flavobacterium album TaxID=2175091 RepID=A0A2S1QX02_9FLAO|nr:hypothetical protein [Flavobacterium album]AWH84932.1 hypothetical protein HYN59_07235 [Flavobacterium album]
MATTLTSTSNYSGKEAGVIIGKAFKEAVTLDSGFVTLNESVNYKLNLRKIELTGGRREYTCGFVPAGSIVLSEKVLEPKKFKDDFEVCLEDFRNQWNDGDLGDSAFNDGDMKVIMDAILAEKLAQEAEAIDTMIWQGDDTDPTEFDGFLKLFAADDDIITVDGIAITKDNVEAQLMRALSEVPAGLQKKPIKVGVASNIAIAYSFLLISKAITNGLASDSNNPGKSDAATEIKFGKFTLVELPGLPDNHMVIAEPKNVVFGTGLKADFNNVHVVNTNETLLDGKVRGSLVYNAGVEYYNSEEIVWYRPATPSV